MTFEAAYAALLDELDVAWKALRLVHADREHLNCESREYEQARAQFRRVEAELFSFKEVWELACRRL